MRLTCPNCAAQYEVPDEVIPANGRDVQCSACGDTWFQHHPDHPEYKPAFDPETPEYDGDDDATIAEFDDEPAAEPDELADAETPEPPVPPRRELAEDVASVLREEADREVRAREAEMSGGLETQPDLGLTGADGADQRTQQAKDRMARLRGFEDVVEEPVSDLVQKPHPDTPADPEADLKTPEIDLGTRANLLPEVEDVDQHIEAQSDGAAEAASARDGSRVATQKEGGSGFARGLRLSIALFVIAAALYIFAPQLAHSVPALTEPLSGYTKIIDQGRASLQALLGQ